MLQRIIAFFQSIVMAIAGLTHKDADGDYKCDNGCGHEFEKPAPEDPHTRYT